MPARLFSWVQCSALCAGALVAVGPAAGPSAAPPAPHTSGGLPEFSELAVAEQGAAQTDEAFSNRTELGQPFGLLVV